MLSVDYSNFIDVRGYEGYLKINSLGQIMIIMKNGHKHILGLKKKKEKKEIKTWEDLLNVYTLG